MCSKHNIRCCCVRIQPTTTAALHSHVLEFPRLGFNARTHILQHEQKQAHLGIYNLFHTERCCYNLRSSCSTKDSFKTLQIHFHTPHPYFRTRNRHLVFISSYHKRGWNRRRSHRGISIFFPQITPTGRRIIIISNNSKYRPRLKSWY